MVKGTAFYSQLSTRDSFNASVRHIQRALEVLDDCGAHLNPADKINEAVDKKEILLPEIPSLVSMLLVDKWGYAAYSGNLASVASDPLKVITAVSAWKRFDFVLGYHHPELGFIVANPKNPGAAETIAAFRKNELLNVYAGTPDDASENGAQEAARLLFRLVEGEAARPAPRLYKGEFAFVEPKKPAARASSARRAAKPDGSGSAKEGTAQDSGGGKMGISPMVSVVVSNELFHDGNVEAWKRIIRSYNARHPDLHVNVYYDGERVVDINSLFKWGKVKHGSCIQFNVSGENIQDVAKLSRYFQQGASPRFAAFLKGWPGTVLNLF